MQVYDLAWSPTGEYIIAGSTDNAARIFTVTDGKFSPPPCLRLVTYALARQMCTGNS